MAERGQFAEAQPSPYMRVADVTVFRDLLVCNCLGQFNSGRHIAGYRHRIPTWFPQVDLHTPPVGVLGDDSFRASMMDPFESTHESSTPRPFPAHFGAGIVNEILLSQDGYLEGIFFKKSA
jgi:hypothetical protein